MTSQAAQLAVNLFKKAAYSGGLAADSAWLGIYQVLLWCEPVDIQGFSVLPHIIDADKLRAPKGVASKRSAFPWQLRAKAAANYVAQKLGCEPSQLQDHVDLLMRHPSYLGVQRQNPLGTAFPALLAHILKTLGNKSASYDLEVPTQPIFPGIVVPGRSKNPKIDIVARRRGRLKAIISCKWSLRHDRLNDISNECPTYKQAASWTRSKIDYLVATNEFDPARLGKLLGDSCVDAVVHVHKPLVTTVCGLDGRLTDMLDLTELLKRSQKW